jgi:hypothetical protein
MAAFAVYDQTYRLMHQEPSRLVHWRVFAQVHREVFMPVRTRTYGQVMRGLLEELTIP